MGRRLSSLVGSFVSDTIVLCYHALGDDPRAEMIVAPTTLEAQVKALLKRGYRPRTFGEVVLNGKSDEKEFAVTFDDAFASVSKLGLPVLERLGVPATVFVCTDFVSSQQPMSWPAISDWARQQPPHEMLSMSWPELRDVQEAGWEIGSHTCSHPRLTELPDEELARELTTSRAICEEHLGKPCTSLAYPQSDFDTRVIDFAESAGYTAACTLPSRFTTPTRYAWPRIGVYEIDNSLRFRLKSSPLIRRIRASRLGAVERRLRELV